MLPPVPSIFALLQLEFIVKIYCCPHEPPFTVIQTFVLEFNYVYLHIFIQNKYCSMFQNAMHVPSVFFYTNVANLTSSETKSCRNFLFLGFIADLKVNGKLTCVEYCDELSLLFIICANFLI